MADIRKVRFIPIDSEPYEGWINFDHVLYAEAHGIDQEEKVAIALVIMDTGVADSNDGHENFRIAAKALAGPAAAPRPKRRKASHHLKPGSIIEVPL
jgi:hypothetical protein